MNYKKNFLTNVVFQASFTPIEILKSEINEEFSNLITSKVGVPCVESKVASVQWSIGNSAREIINSKWDFKSSPHSVIINADAIRIITNHYTNYQDYHPLIITVMDGFMKAYTPLKLKLSMRYINNIKFSHGSTYDFDGIIDPKLLIQAEYFKDKGLARSLGTVVLKTEDLTTQFTFGFFNREFPNLISKRDFTLDYECNCMYDYKEPIGNFLLKIRNQINTLFEQSIGEKLRQELNT